MIDVTKQIVVLLNVASLFYLRFGVAHSNPYLSNGITDKQNAEEGDAVAGRIVSVPTKVYRDTFKASLKLGQCPLVMEEGSIRTCKDEFEGEEVYIPKGTTTVDVTRAESSEDILLHIMGGIGGSVGVLGLASVNLKVKTAVTTETNRNSLNLMSSYETSRGVITLHHPRPKYPVGDKALFLSEIELGGNELLLVTLEFEDEKKKAEVEASVTFNVLFISMTAKLNYVKEKFKSKASCRVQFKSSWRKDTDQYYSDLALCIPNVKRLEDMYTNGPKELKTLSPDDERLHYIYYFSSWKASPYGKQFNLALINHDLEFLTEQNTEIKAVIQRINKLKDQRWPSEIKSQMTQLNETLSDMTNRISSGLDKYHTLQLTQIQDLRNIYGKQKAPQYYMRYLEKIIASQ